jgi:hypothetical protein
LEHCLLPITRSILEHAHDSYICQLDGFAEVAMQLRTAASWNDGLRHSLSALLGPLDMKTTSRPPFPTNSDFYILGVLHLVCGTYTMSLAAFGNAGRIVRSGVGLTAKVETLFALEQFDDVIATVIEGEIQDSNEEDRGAKRPGFAKKALQMMMRGSASSVEV